MRRKIPACAGMAPNDALIRHCRSGRQTGYLLLPVAVAIALIGVIAFLISRQSAIEVDLTTGEFNTARAEYVAQAGLQHALRQHAQQKCGPYSDLTNYPFGSDEYNTKLVHDLGGTANFSALTDQDSWIGSDNPTANNASDTKLEITFESGNIERPMYRYDLSSIPAKANILSARAWFYVVKEHPEGPVDIHPITADWTETDATWDSMGASLDSAVLVSIPAQPTPGIWVSVNLTAQVQSWINGQLNYGITLNSTSEGTQSEYGSRESATESYIEVIVGTPPTSPAKLSSTSKLDGGGAATIVHEVTLLQQPGFSQLQPDAVDGQDAEIWDQSPNNNYGASAETWVSSAASDTTRSLLRFNTGAIPAGAQILQATLSLERQSGSGADQPVSAHRIRNSWSEDSVTWNEREAGTNWDMPGADFDIAAIATTPVGPANQRYAWNITPLVQGWVDGSYPNHGVALVAAIAGMPGERFYTSDEADPSRWPSLSVTYACACGQVCAPVQGSGNLLMVVISPTVLAAEDQKAKDLFESWGYTVSVISESANQSTYDALIANNDVVFISETVNSNSVGTKLVNAPIGVVSQDGDYNPDLGLAPGASLKVGNAIDIVSTDHYITRPFAVGAHEIYTADMEQAIVTGSLTADQQTLAEIGGDGSLVVLDQGAAMEGGGTAAGRRVILPLGTRYRFDWDYLNANGRLLVQRAFEWGMNKDKVSKGNLLLVVVNPSNLTPQESAKKTLFESWGYNVNLIDESDNQTDFDAAVAVNDVVYITEDVTSANVNTKLVNAEIGVVTEEDNLSDEFGMAAGIAWESGTQVEINDNSHYITSPFSLGLLTILTANESLAYVTGAQSPDLGQLASSSSGYGVVTLDAGDAMFGGGAAAGRRAQLPWGGDNFDVNHLNADGLTILQRALEWGAGASSPPSFDVLFVVGDPSSLTVEQQDKKTLIEGWGHRVTLIATSEDQAAFDTAAASADVVYVPELGTTPMSELGSKANDLGVGVITEEARRALLLGGFALSPFVDTDSITITDNSHYLTETLVTGPVTLSTAVQSMWVLKPTLALDLHVLGELGAAEPGLAYLEIGERRNDGSPAPARRVKLPWGSFNFDVNLLTPDGLEIMRRAIEWGAGIDLDLGPLAHWKLDETAGTTAVDSEGGHDGTLTNYATPAWIAGVIDGGLEFDGSDDYVDAGSFDVTGSGITMMGWFNADALTTADERIVSKAQGTAEDDAWWQLSSSDSGSDRFLRMRIKAGGTTTTLADSSTNLTTGEWYFAVATYDNASGEMKLYLDGVEVANRSHAVGGALDTDASVPVALGANGTAQRFFNGILDDVRVYDRALSTAEISDLYAVSAPSAPGYTEIFQNWSAGNDDTWETFDLGTFGVPANAVIEVAIVNADTSKEQWAGVRAVGSSLERRFLLHEAEGGGLDTLTLHVQANADGRIEHYTSKKGETSFILLGYWTGGSYVELFDSFTANDDGTWINENLGSVGLGPNQVAEIVILNTDTGAQRLAGVRTPGLGLQRRFNLHEAESGGVDGVSMMVNTDGSSRIQVYAQVVSDIDYYAVGYWSVPPGTYTETGGVHGQATDGSTWEQADLTVFGVPADSVAQFVISSEIPNFNRELGIREVGSGQLRVVDLHKAEAGGSEDASLHVNVDSASRIEWYSASGTSDRYFYPVGWWDLSP